MLADVRFGSSPDILQRSMDVCSTPRKRTSFGTAVMSVPCQFRTKCIAAKRLVDQLVRAVEQLWRHLEAERFCGLEVDDQLVFCRLLNWQIRRASSLENLIDVGRCAAISLNVN